MGNLSVAAPATGVNFTGLANGSLYNFTVVATNAAGNSSASLPSNAVTPCVPNVQDIAISMSAPSSFNAGSFATFTMTICSLGPGDAPNVTLADTAGSSDLVLHDSGILLHSGHAVQLHPGRNARRRQRHGESYRCD